MEEGERNVERVSFLLCFYFLGNIACIRINTSLFLS